MFRALLLAIIVGLAVAWYLTPRQEKKAEEALDRGVEALHATPEPAPMKPFVPNPVGEVTRADLVIIRGKIEEVLPWGVIVRSAPPNEGYDYTMPTIPTTATTPALAEQWRIAELKTYGRLMKKRGKYLVTSDVFPVDILRERVLLVGLPEDKLIRGARIKVVAQRLNQKWSRPLTPTTSLISGIFAYTVDYRLKQGDWMWER